MMIIPPLMSNRCDAREHVPDPCKKPRINDALQIYGHLLPNMQSDAAEKMDALLMPDNPARE